MPTQPLLLHHALVELFEGISLDYLLSVPLPELLRSVRILQLQILDFFVESQQKLIFIVGLRHE